MQPRSIQFKNSIIHYRHGGQGTQPLICFHGYGETAASFNFLEEKVGSKFAIIAIDLPFHGSTQWNDAPPDAGDIADLINALLTDCKLQKQNLHLLGFSLGGRIALCALPALRHHVTRLVLLAPDGLKVNFWYWLATQTTIGNRLFRLTMSKPGWFMGMLRASNRLRLINQSIYKFVEYFIHDEQVRKALYQRWTGLGKCTPQARQTRDTLLRNKIELRLLYGKYDRIIRHEPGQRSLSGHPQCRIDMLDCGHQVLHPKNADAIAAALFS